MRGSRPTTAPICTDGHPLDRLQRAGYDLSNGLCPSGRKAHRRRRSIRPSLRKGRIVNAGGYLFALMLCNAIVPIIDSGWPSQYWEGCILKLVMSISFPLNYSGRKGRGAQVVGSCESNKGLPLV
jgi:hypothetical protein